MEVIWLEMGDRVVCDYCNADFTDSDESGGIYGFGSKAICPEVYKVFPLKIAWL